MNVDLIYLALFVLVSCAAAFGVGRFCRNGSSTDSCSGAWERATNTKYEGMAPLDRPVSSGWSEPAPHLDVAEGEVVDAIEVEFICDLSEVKSA